MGANKRMFEFMTYGLIKGVGIFWLVMLIVNIASIGVSFSTSSNFTQGPMIIDQQSVSFVASNFFAAFIFLIVYSIEMYYENFSLAIGFGGTRKRFYLNVLINNILLVLLLASIQILLIKLEYHILSGSIYSPIVEYGLFNIREDGIVSIIFKLVFVCLAFLSLTNLIGILQYRFSYKFWISSAIFIIVSQRAFNIRAFNILGRIIMALPTLIENSTGGISNLIILGIIIIIIAYSLGFLLVRKADIK